MFEFYDYFNDEIGLNEEEKKHLMKREIRQCINTFINFKI